jgi:hypothetical protein
MQMLVTVLIGTLSAFLMSDQPAVRTFEQVVLLKLFT